MTVACILCPQGTRAEQLMVPMAVTGWEGRVELPAWLAFQGLLVRLGSTDTASRPSVSSRPWRRRCRLRTPAWKDQMGFEIPTPQSEPQTPEPRSGRPERLREKHFHWRGHANTLLEVATALWDHKSKVACHTGRCAHNICCWALELFWGGLSLTIFEMVCNMMARLLLWLGQWESHFK